MKNYFQKIITLFTGNDYPESTQQDFYKWLVDEEHTSEKDEALQKLWNEAHKRGTATDMQESYELLKKNAGIPPIIFVMLRLFRKYALHLPATCRNLAGSIPDSRFR